MGMTPSTLSGQGRIGHVRHHGVAFVFGLCLCVVQSALAQTQPPPQPPPRPDTFETPPQDSVAVSAPSAPCNFTKISTPTEIKALITKIASQEAFPANFLLAIAQQESGLRMDRVSSAGAIGIMQLMPATAARFKVNICDEADNIRGSIRFLRVLQEKYQNPLYTLAAYNAGEEAVDRNGGIPNYTETVRFIAAIMTNLYSWKPLSARESGLRRQNSAGPAANTDQSDKKKEEWTQGFVLHVEE
ncbi:lytic transglycosylase domain-containing protein [Labrys portucalensis]|uniref:Lytic transglycosylase domain-containing protein n=1 Tax=Labrys neptuniae TaxID=376174 RepID=A0ABV6ZQP9_9HYPH